MRIVDLMKSSDGDSGFAATRGQQRSVLSRPLAACAALLVLLGGVSACATSGGGSQSADNFWREDLGRLNTATIEEALGKIIQKHALRLDQRHQTGRDIRWELNWIPREVLAEEELRGVTDARNRIVIRGVESGIGEITLFRMTWELENEVTTLSDRNWHPDIVPEAVKEEFRPIYTDLRLEVRTGVRR